MGEREQGLGERVAAAGEGSPSEELPRLVGPYRLEERVGAGGMGAVYRAHDTRLERTVALKRVRADSRDDGSMRRRFRREAKVVAQLSHPAIVPIFDFVESPDDDWIVMEWIEGESLADLCRRGPTVARVLHLAHQIASGLAEAHRKGIVHRDLKLENVMVTADGRARILDFGLALMTPPRVAGRTDGDAEHAERLTNPGMLIGTYRAMAPEHIHGHELDARADLFAFGVLLYEALSGQSPFQGKSSYALLTQIVVSDPMPLGERVEGVPPEVLELVEHLLEKDPVNRPRDAGPVERILAPFAREAGGDEAQAARLEAGGSGPAAPSAGKLDLEAHRSTDAGGFDAGGFEGARRLAEIETLESHAPPVRGPDPETREDEGAPESEPAPEPERAKNPPPLARAALAAAVLLAALILGWRFLAPPGLPVSFVAALPPEVIGPRTAASAAMAEGLELASQRALLALEGLSVLSPLQVEANLRLDLPPASPSGEVPEFPRPGPRQLAARLGVEDIVAGRVSCDGLICSIVIERSASDGFLLFSERVEAPLDEPLALEAVMVGAIARAFPERRWRRGAKPAIEVSSADYRSLLDLRRSFEQGDAKADGGAALLEELATLMTRAPNFVDAPLLAARVARHRFFDSRLSQHMSQARALAERARQLSPADPRPLVELIDVESELGNVREARALLAELDAMQPGRVDVAIRRSVLLELEGKPQEALAAVRAIARSRPSTDSLRELGSLELRLGEIDAARATLLELLEGNPDSYAGQALLAELELTHGQADRASQLWETLAERSPSFANLSNWALANMLQGRYRDAEARLERAVELAPQSASAWINLADARQLAGRSGEAASLYARALQLAEEDPEPDSWRQLIVRAQALARLRRPGEAIETLQGALQKAPDNPEVAYVAALVHALLGEMASSEAQTRRALRLGVGERWFFFPAFAPLRSGDGPLPAAAPEVRGPEGFSLPREAD